MNDPLDRMRARVADVDARWDAFRKERPTATTGEFVAHLYKAGALNAATLSEVVGVLDVELGPSEDGEHELGLLGAGAMGEVLLARDEQLRRHVAKKRMARGLLKQPALARRFLHEVQIMAQLDHPNIVPVYRMDTDPKGVPSYTMKLVRGETLEERLEALQAQATAWKNNLGHTLPVLLEVFLKICEAIHYAHTRGVIHRDLKPANVMIGAHGEVLVMDWGIARRIGPGEELAGDGSELSDDPNSTQNGTAIGTPNYMSPEQANAKNDQLDGRSDQYALGLILGELVTLRRMRTGKTAEHVYNRALDGDLDPLAPLVPGKPVPRELAAIIHKATQRRPEHRYPDVEALADDVRRYLRDEEVTARRDTAFQRVQRWVGRHRDATVATVLGLTLAVVLVAVAGLFGGLAVLEAHRLRAAKREEAVMHVVSEVALQAHRIDSRFKHFAGLLTGLAFAAEHALAGPPRPGLLVVAPPDVKFRDDLVRSKVYADDLMIVTPTILAAPGSSPTEDAKLRLASVAPELLHVLVGSASNEALGLPLAMRVDHVANKGVPAVWTYVATEDGLMVTLPGAGGYPEDYDARAQYWYNDQREHGPVWHAAKRDDSDKERLGSLVTCAHALWDGSRFLGVAALDISLKHVVGEILAPPGVDVPVQTWLVDASGATVASSTQPDAGLPPAFPHAELVPLFREAASGTRELPDHGGLVVWARLPSLDWSYVVVGPESLVEAP